MATKITSGISYFSVCKNLAICCGKVSDLWRPNCAVMTYCDDSCGLGKGVCVRAWEDVCACVGRCVCLKVY